MSISVSTPAGIKGALIGDLKRKAISKAGKIFKGVVKRSPVREGSFRANWKITQHRKSRSTFKRVGTVQNPAPAPKLRKLRTARGKIPKIYITNNSPYAVLLEAGSSDQAPYGIIAATLASLK